MGASTLTLRGECLTYIPNSGFTLTRIAVEGSKRAMHSWPLPFQYGHNLTRACTFARMRPAQVRAWHALYVSGSSITSHAARTGL